MRPHSLLPFAAFALVLVPLLARPLPAQGTVYTIDASASAFATGCIGPSVCLCPALFLGDISGSFELVPVLPPLGPIFEYDVVNFDAEVVQPSGNTMVILGTGFYTIDAILDQQTLQLDVTVDGVPRTFLSVAPSEVLLPFPGELGVSAFAEIAPPCAYDGMYITASAPTGVSFIRGDANEDGGVDLADAIASLGLLFPVPGSIAVECLDAADANDDGTVNIADPIALLAGLFSSGPPPPPPNPDCGVDPTADSLACPAHAQCP